MEGLSDKSGIKNVDNVDNFVEKYYLQPSGGVEILEKRHIKEFFGERGKKIRLIYVNRLSTKKSTCVLHKKSVKACG